MTPAPKRGLLEELPWEDQQKIMGFSLAKINNLKRDGILRAVNVPDSATLYSGGGSFKRGGSYGALEDFNSGVSPID